MESSTMEVKDIPMPEIFSDSTFNSRGQINPSDVVDLAKNIQKNGLLQPITIQPYTLRPPYRFRIVVGHRRHAAFVQLEKETIPAIIKEGLDEVQALALNFIENINRKDLNIVQEAHALERFVKAGVSIEETAKLINKGKGWIQVRFTLLKLPPDIQQEAAGGLITQEQIKDIAAIPITDDQYRVVRQIKDARRSGDKRALKVNKKKSDPTKRKRRDPYEISQMMGHILDTIGPCIVTRALAWANGDISGLDLYRDLREYAKEQGVSYEVPKEVLPLLSAG